MRTRLVCLWMLAAAVAAPAHLDAGVKTWNGTSGDWSDGSRWTNGVPVAGDEVVIPAGTVLLSAATPDLQSFTMEGGTLMFTNWSTRLSADTVTLQGRSVITLPPAYTNTVMSNRVWFACDTFLIETGALINADAKGYKGGITGTVNVNGHGPGGGIGRGGAASYGGKGADRLIDTYGDASAPTGPGSGGAGDSWALSGNGGGAILIQASGVATVDGTITANGGNGLSRSAGGSGGSIFITCSRIAGAGLLSAAGGQSDYGDSGNGSGGGRIAVIYDSAAQAAAPLPGLTCWAHGGTVFNAAEAGTLYFPDTRLLETNVFVHRGQWVSPGLTAYAWASLTISNGWLHFPQAGFQLTVSNTLSLVGNGTIAPLSGRPYRNGGRLEMSNGLLRVHGNLLLTNTACLALHPGEGPSAVTVGGDAVFSASSLVAFAASPTNGAYLEPGGTLAVTGLLDIASRSWIVPVSHWTNGGSVFMEAGSLRVDSDSGINADGRGFGNISTVYSPVTFGPGRGGYAFGGGGYGGHGGAALGGPAYGSATNPAEAGSSGGDQAVNGGFGGGLIRIAVAGGAVVNGTLTANGQDGAISGVDRRAGGGSGGGIFLSCAWIAGTNGLMTADGGMGHNGTYASGGGGGGRIAVHFDPAQQDAMPVPDVTFSAQAGRGIGTSHLNNDLIDGEPGTLYFPDSRFFGTDGIVRHSGLWLAPGIESLSVDNLLVSNRWIRFPAAQFRVAVAGDATIVANGRLDLSNGLFTVGGNLVLTNRGTVTLHPADNVATGPVLSVAGDLLLRDRSYLNVYAAATNAGDAFGAFVDVAGLLSLASNCWVWPYSHVTNGGSVRFEVGGLDIETPAAGFYAAGRGCRGGTWTVFPGYGNGRGYAGTVRGGGGYGGFGGVPGQGGGMEYGSAEEPADAGSGGAGHSSGNSSGGAGGGLIWIRSANRMRINGALNADGQNAGTAGGLYGGGGSGGGIYLHCLRLSGNGLLTVRGGDGGLHSSNGGGSGGGGRIAVWRGLDDSAFTTNVTAGAAVNTNRNGAAGTWYLGSVRVPGVGTVIQVR